MSVRSYAFITVAQVKNHLGISGSTYDTILETYINGATDFIEKQLGGRRLLRPSTASTVYYDGGDGYQTYLNLKNYPISSTGTITFQYNNGTISTPNWVDFNANDYHIYHTKGILKVPVGLPEGNRNIKVVALCGYAPYTTGTGGSTGLGSDYWMPSDLILLALRMVSRIWNKRKSDGVKSESIGESSITWDKEIDTEDARIINSYKRTTF
jgi:hypothetical protein